MSSVSVQAFLLPPSSSMIRRGYVSTTFSSRVRNIDAGNMRRSTAPSIVRYVIRSLLQYSIRPVSNYTRPGLLLVRTDQDSLHCTIPTPHTLHHTRYDCTEIHTYSGWRILSFDSHVIYKHYTYIRCRNCTKKLNNFHFTRCRTKSRVRLDYNILICHGCYQYGLAYSPIKQS